MSAAAKANRKSMRGEYIETDSGNKVSRRALISGTPNITLAGKTVVMADVILRGDLTRPRTTTTSSTSKDKDGEGKEPQKQTTSTAISVGRYTIIAPSSILRPPARQSATQYTPYPLKIGDHVLIGPNSTISAAQIHSHVVVGARCVLQPFCIIKEHVKILDDTIVPAGMVVPPGVVIGGRPARVVDEVGEGWGEVGARGAGWVEGGDLREVVRGIK